MIRSLTKHLDIQALKNNYDYMRQICTSAKVVAVIKSEAYGHGLLRVAKALEHADGLAVACVSEGIALRRAGVTQKIIVLQGGHELQDIELARTYNLTLVVHCQRQISGMQQSNCQGIECWIKFDTGMHRLGFDWSQHETVISEILKLRGLASPPVLMSHFCCADSDEAHTRMQLQKFEELCACYEKEGVQASIANSAAALSLSESHKDWVRVGLAVYGVTAKNSLSKHKKNLKPVMHLTAPVIAIRDFEKGDRLGYNGEYVCAKKTRAAIIGTGYGDGYPWHAASGTPVWVSGKRCRIAGHISMDMITVDATGVDLVVGDNAELWGEHIAVSEVAEHASTIPYELLCSVSSTATTLI
ncbi:MAG: alanine racemase [Gammaproteobacteria bacterium]|nr:alanine racemase [Gammaproteobacteria bacterium]